MCFSVGDRIRTRVWLLSRAQGREGTEIGQRGQGGYKVNTE